MTTTGSNTLRTDRYRVLLFIKKLPSLSTEEFSRHWLDVHSKLIIKFAEGKQGLIKYEQLHVNQEEKARLQELGVPVFDYDGAALFDVATLDVFTQLGNDPQYASLIIPDENSFFVRSTAFVVNVNIASIVDHDEDLAIAAQMGSASSAYLKVPTKLRKDRARMLLMFKRKEGMSIEEMGEYWLNEHARVVKQDTKMGKDIIKYEQLHLTTPNTFGHLAEDSGMSFPDWDGIALMDVPSFDSLRYPEDRGALAQDGEKWQGKGKMCMFPVDVATIIDEDIGQHAHSSSI